MHPVGQIRIRNLGDLQQRRSPSPPVFPPLTPPSLPELLPLIKTNNSPDECVDLTEDADAFTTPITNAAPKKSRTKRTQAKASGSTTKKENITQTKLDAFFKAGSSFLLAPKKFKELPEKIDDTPSVVVTKQSAQPRRNLGKLSLRRKLIKNDEEHKGPRTRNSTRKKEKSPEKEKSPPIEKSPPHVIPGVVDLCMDTDDEEENKPLVGSPLPPKRPATVRSEKPNCPSYKVVAGTTFAVDGFKYGRIEGVTTYFLTHFHADHYIGLTKKFSMPIYTSKITANLLQAFIPVDQKLVNILHVDSTITIDGVQITAIDANHCPGALMLLFQLPCGKRILHTGDFRACIEMEFHPSLIQRNIDILYLDTTYISSKYSFQSQAKSIADAIQHVRDFKENNENKRILFVCGSYLVGKEKFWLSIAKAFDFKIWTDDNRRKVMRAVDNDEILQRLVPDARKADMHVISMMKIGYKGIYEYWTEFKDYYDMVLAIRPSGWEKNSKPQFRGEINVVGVEYSEHSSHDEMRRFVGFLKPKEVISTVPTGKDFTKCPEVPLSWYRKECFSPMKKQASIFSYLTVKEKQ